MPDARSHGDIDDEQHHRHHRGHRARPPIRNSTSPRRRRCREDEVLAQLIFGRSMSNLSPLQIAQLAEAAAQLAGVGGSTSLLETLRSKIGVDDLDVTTDEDGGTAVSAGKYLNDRTYVTIEKGDKAGLRQGDDRPQCRARRQIARRGD